MESPVYIQIHNSIKRDIEAGKWAVGDRIPSERELSVTFGVSRMTLRQAIQTLVDEGILERRVGAGTYVANQKVQEKMSGVTSFTDIMLAQGKKPSSKTVSYHVASPSLSEKEKLQLTEDAQVLRMERIRYADDVPISFEVATVPEELVREFSKPEITSSLYRTLERKAGLTLGGAQQTVTAQVASERIAELLDIKRGDPILRLRQISFLKSGEPFEYVRTQYVGSRFEFYLER
ncbi:GntR family transcriptional regulator [Loigolactobacillus coryniformis]|jgi:GntR family transcriptional regulator|uniref:Transcriptional regulator, GntR family n=3 Tax=Loigolactobacillus coryniformis TaxID=1610 RepID=J3JB19_9LACO|nr:GntR family transcriptional regulator [Loigolactobacillus coryniformis]RRG04953.1 MAG: GntR family transcriptional regulator [Lactobacillus sp.]ATO44706.1 GntR family transcriptional regulator [Loigolactobacillus coryniformis subsp. torquens DSM 20004 = KCTC 3535]EJN55339.1 Transcriptional regulator, GntR family [Loigolactobacillus coryniformis subsp. coryniformis CECT 5711]KRK77573.1 GntR family transcriptional regulator [Loigolactobacillus coryniformis subsp. torquens DSM 20004 = KCTC 3535